MPDPLKFILALALLLTVGPGIALFASLAVCALLTLALREEA